MATTEIYIPRNSWTLISSNSIFCTPKDNAIRVYEGIPTKPNSGVIVEPNKTYEFAKSTEDLYAYSENGATVVLNTYKKISDVNIQDQSSELLSLYLGEIKDTVTILSNTAKNDTTIDIETTGYTPLVGEFICLQEIGKITQAEITAVTPILGNQYTLTLAIPLDYGYTTQGGCMILDVDMSVDGSTTPVTFQIKPKAGTRWDITRIMTAMVLSSAGDDGLYGNITALTNGTYYRKEDSLESNNLFNAKENSDYAIEGYDVAYPIRSGGGGSHGFRSRITFAGQNKQGVVIRLDGDSGDSFTATVRDNLTGINRFRTKIQGHVVED